MKKNFLKVISFVLILTMILPMIPVAIFAQESASEPTPQQEQGVDLAALGQDTYYTGKNYKFTPTMDGSIDSGYVCVTPNGTDTVFTNRALGNVASGTAISTVDKNTFTDGHKTFADSIVTKYYVAQDDDYVYIAIKLDMSAVPYVPADGNTYQASGNVMSHLKLGFNTNDYTQQISLYTQGQYMTQSSSSATVNGITYTGTWKRYPFIVQGIAQADTFNSKAGASSPIIAEPVDESGIAKDSILVRAGSQSTGTFERTYELKLSKAGIISEYQSLFSVTPDFSAMYVGMSSYDYKWANDKENNSTFWATGTVIDSATASANDLTTYIPDKVVFGTKEVTEERFAELGRNTYYTGKNYTYTPTIDGKLDSSYADVTPNGADITLVDNDFYYSKSSGINMSVVDKATLTDSQKTFVDSLATKYYVSQDTDNVYLFIEQTMSKTGYTDANSISYAPTGKVLSNLRLGFNPKDYTQQIDFYSHGQYASAGSTATVAGISYTSQILQSGSSSSYVRYPMIVQGLANDRAYTSNPGISNGGSATGIIATYSDSNGVPVDSYAQRDDTSVSGKIIRTYELKLNKAAIIAQYATVFGATITAEDFSSMYIGMSTEDNAWANSKDNRSLGWVTGAVTDLDTETQRIYGLTDYIPDKVVFGYLCPGAEAEHTVSNCTSKVVATQEGNCVTDDFIQRQCDCGKLFYEKFIKADGHNYEGDSKTCLDCGGTAYTVDGYKSVTSNGSVGAEEYSTTANFASAVAASNSVTFATLNPEYLKATKLAQSASISFAHDAEKIYIGVVGTGATSGDGNSLIRDGYALRLGFDPAHPENYVGITLIECCHEKSIDSNDSSKTAVHNANTSNTTNWDQGSYRGIVRSNGSVVWNPSIYNGQTDPYGFTRLLYSSSNYPITAMTVVKQTVSGDAISLGNYGRTNNQQAYTYWEIELDKDLLLSFYNGMYPSGEGVENLDTMLFSLMSFYGPASYYPQEIFNGAFGNTSNVSNAMEAYTYDTVSFVTPEISLDDFGQDDYYTGGYHDKPTVNVNGAIDSTDGYVCVTPNGVPTIVTNTGFGSYGKTASNRVMTTADVKTNAESFVAGISTNYYVAQDNNYVYLAVQQTLPSATHTVDEVTYDPTGKVLTTLRLGFNPDDYTQQISLYSHGQYISQGSSATYSGITYNSTWTPYPFIVEGLADASSFTTKSGTATTIIEKYVTDAGAPLDSVMKRTSGTGTFTRTYEIKLSKAGITAAYKSVFGADTEVDFDSMFIGMSSSDYAWAKPSGSSSATDCISTYWVNGAIVSTQNQKTYGLTSFIPDEITFGSLAVTEEVESQIGKDTYHTGKDFTSTTVTVDGFVKPADGYVSVTPSGAGTVVVNTSLGNVSSRTQLLAKQTRTEHEAFLNGLSTKYYVAQDEDYVYLAVEQRMAVTSYTVDDVTYNLTSQVFTYLRLGFNPADYTQQIVLYSDGRYVSQASNATVGGATFKTQVIEDGSTSSWIRYPFIVQGLADAYGSVSKVGTATDIIEDYVDANGKIKDSILQRYTDNGEFVRLYEMKLSKDAIEAEYATAFGTDNIDFSTMFIGMTCSDYAWANDTSNYSLYWANGAVTDMTTALKYGMTPFVLDEIAFYALCPGADAEHTIYNCQYTEIENVEVGCENDGYVKNQCDRCGKEFYSSYDNATGHTFDQQVIKDEALYQAGNCGESTKNKYYYSCHCGAVEGDANHTFEGDLLPHVWTSPENPIAANVKTEADCDSKAVYYQVCSVCSLNAAQAGEAEKTYEYGEALGHNMETQPAKPVTCIAVGWDAYEQCSRCGEKEGFVLKDPLRWTAGLSQSEVDKGDHTSLNQYGQKIYSTGTDEFMADDGVMYLNGDRDVYEPYVDITPNFVDKTGLSGDYSQGTSDVTAIAEPSPYSSNLKYYVAQDSESIYLLIEDYAPYNEVDGEDGLSRWDESILRNFYRIKIGFDPENYDRALYLRLNGGNFPENAASYLYVVGGGSEVNIKNNASVNSVIETSFVRYSSTGSQMGAANDNYANQAGGTWYNQWVARLEIKINKDLVDDAYAALNDSKSTSFDFNQMFVGVSAQSLRFGESTSTGGENVYYAYTNYGSFRGKEAGFNVNYIPDVVVFGKEKNVATHGCDLTAHRTGDKYLYNLVDNGDGTGTAWFYHSCANETEEGVVCSVVGATTFMTTYTTDGSGNKVYTIVHTEQGGVPDAKFAVNGNVVTCTNAGTYYKHCSCGLETEKSNETYTIDALGHDWTDHDNNYKTPRYCATCKTTDSSVYITQPTEGSVKNILMIGNSFCYYFVEELYAIAATAGVELNVANLYVSGRSVSGHRTHLEADPSPNEYAFYLTNENGRQVISSATTIDAALAYAKTNLGGDWDVISLQQHFEVNTAKRYDVSYDVTFDDAKYLFDYVKDTETDAKLYWQQTWAYQVGYDRSGNTVPDKAVQTHTYRNIKRVSEEVAAANGVTLVPSGDAWQIMRNEYDYDGMCDKPYGTGDYYHDGDTGGGQYLNACVWFETVTGESCMGNTWRPEYALNVNATYLQEAAHKAVAQIYGPAYARHECVWTDATCEDPRMCLACGIVDLENPALGHINVGGTTFTDACNVEVADRNCTRCGEYVKVVHNYDENHVCTVCGSERAGWIPPEDIGTYYATDVSANKPTIDGIINVGEYGNKISVNDPWSLSNSDWGGSWSDVAHDRDITSKYMDYYFAYDDEYIYIAINDVGNDGMSRNNYRFNFGFDLNDVTSYFQFQGYQTNGVAAWAKLSYYKGGTGWIEGHATSELICESFIRKVDMATGNTVAVGDLLAANGNVNHEANNWKLVVEFKLSKDDIIKCMNDITGTNYAELSDAMWISVVTQSYGTNDRSGYFRWLGRNDITGIQGNYADYVPENLNFSRDWMFDLIVFGDQNTEILAADPNPCREGHILTQYEAKSPTATEYGYEAYEECSRCTYTTYTPIRPYDAFKTGYQRVDITPDVPTGDFTSIADALYATCVAINDGIDTVILISIDISSINATHSGDIRRKVAYATGVPEENVFVTATHTHSSRHFTSDDIWRFESFVAIANAAKAAVDDLEDTQIFIGSSAADNLAYVRRYTNGTSFASVKPQGKNWYPVADEDNTLQIVRMVREGKDIVMTNWQAHLAHAKNQMPTALSSDIAHYMRKDIEEGDTDTQVIYLAGASGNISLEDGSTNTTTDYITVAQTLADIALDVISGGNLEEIEPGKINVSIEEAYQAKTKVDSDAVVQAAEARRDADAALEGDNYLLSRNNSEYIEMRLGAVSFGELAFITAPYEMFDSEGLYIKNNSKFKMTLIITNAGADLAYMPSANYFTSAYGYVGYDVEANILQNPYETLCSYFGETTAKETSDKFLEMLDELYELGEVIDINITYTSMDFTYSSGNWNPTNLAYDEGTWSAGNNGGEIAVTNLGTVDVSITFEFTAENAYEFLTGTFSGAELDQNVAALPTKEQVLVTFTLRGIPTADLENAPVGSITITIAEAAAAQGG